LIIAALGGQIEVINLLIHSGANVNAQIHVQSFSSYNIVEVASIRQDINLLIYLYDTIPDTCTILQKLFISTKIDEASKLSVSKTIEFFSNEYKSIYNIKPHQFNSLSTTQKISYNIFNNNVFGKILATFFEMNKENVEYILSFSIIFLNIIDDYKIRHKFIENNGLKFLSEYIEERKSSIHEYLRQIELSNLRMDTNSSDDFIKSKKNIKFDDNFLAKTECTCIGKVICTLSLYPDVIPLINDLDFLYNETIINYIRCLFDWNQISKRENINNEKSERKSIKASDSQYFENSIATFNSMERKSSKTESSISNKQNDINNIILFEQYIQSYIKFLGNIAFVNDYSKLCFIRTNMFQSKILFNISQRNFLPKKNLIVSWLINS
jgi:hypothetical protein